MIKKILKIIFVTLGVIFSVIIIAVVAFVIIDPFNLRPLFSDLFSSPQANTPSNTATNDKNPLLNASQEKLLETMGVDVGSLPSEITPEMEACFTEALGAERVKQIMAGDSPSPIDLLKAKNCL